MGLFMPLVIEDKCMRTIYMYAYYTYMTVHNTAAIIVGDV